MELEVSINGVITSQEITPNESLVALLRRAGYNSVKAGCETGECGACTVLVDGVPRPSCVMLAAQSGGCAISTTESLGNARNLHPLQQAFIEVGAAPCGFCAPGMLLSAHTLLKRNPSPTESEVRDALSGNLCRCSGYTKPVQAVLRAAALMRGQHVEALSYNVVQQPGEKRAVAQAVSDLDALKLVTGKAVFAADATPQGMLYGAILTSPHAHAVIRDIDISQARALPGVHAVLTYHDTPRTSYASVAYSPLEKELRDRYVLDYLVRYAGDRVAVAAAETPELAEEAIRLIHVDYDVLPPVLDLRTATEQSAPDVHPESESLGIYDAKRNIAARLRSERGNVERGFAGADLVVEGEYLVPLTQQVPLEKHATITYFDDNDDLVVRTNTQAPVHIQGTLSRLLNVPSSRIHVLQTHAGGGEGVTQEVVLEDLCALLTIATNRPVMLTQSRKAEFESGRARAQYVVRLKTGVQHDGTIIANQMVLLTSTGAYGSHPLIGQKQAIGAALALYPCPNMRLVSEVLYTNLPPVGVDYGLSAPQEFFALECHMDEIARRLKMDALALRRKNWLKPGAELPLTQQAGNDRAATVASSALEECVHIVEEKLNWHGQRGSSANGRLRRGVGLALAMYRYPAAQAHTGGAAIKLKTDGTFEVSTGVSHNGDGSATLLTQMVAEALNIPVADVFLPMAGRDGFAFEAGSSASATLYVSGEAVLKAAEQMLRQVLAVAGRMLNVRPESLEMHAGLIVAADDERVTVQQVATHALYVEGRYLMATASANVQRMPTTFAAQGVEVEVDCETGMLRVLKALSAVDVGRSLNPMLLEAQILRGAALSLGTGLFEEVLYDQKGALLSRDLRDYHIYNALDIPAIQAFLVESTDPVAPFGAKAVLEVAGNSMAPALANAVSDALGGVSISQIPLTPERVLKLVHAQNNKQ
jgi:putative selenate reductase molybdopterin-binding subunit